jgi:hypothetical protein
MSPDPIRQQGAYISRTYYQRHIQRHHSAYITNLYETRAYWELFMFGRDVGAIFGDYISMYAAAGLAGVSIPQPFDLTRTHDYVAILAKYSNVGYPKPTAPQEELRWECPVCCEDDPKLVQPLVVHMLAFGRGRGIDGAHTLCEDCLEHMANRAAIEGESVLKCPECRHEVELDEVHDRLVQAKVARTPTQRELTEADLDKVPLNSSQGSLNTRWRPCLRTSPYGDHCIRAPGQGCHVSETRTYV